MQAGIEFSSSVRGEHTNGTDDGGPAEVLGRNHLSVELGVPFQLHAVGEVVEGGGSRHFDVLDQFNGTNCKGNRRKERWRLKRMENGDGEKLRGEEEKRE